MNYLLSCPCGHTLESHSFEGGCEGCKCLRNRRSALDSIVRAVRVEQHNDQIVGERLSARGREL
jgi:hypothetical protein